MFHANPLPMSYSRFAVFIVAVAASTGAQALDNQKLKHFLSLSLEDLVAQKVTIATNTAKSLGTAPSVVSVVTADDIKATGATDLADILQSVPGIHVFYNHFGMRPLISFRGANNKQTLVMVDGAPVSDLMWRIGIFWKGIPASIIERVEIIRGPGSALFGTDASAGVINVITKTAGAIDGTRAAVRLGSFDSQSATLEHGGKWNGLDIAMTADLSKTNGHSPRIRADAQTRNDLATGTSVSHAPGDAQYGWDSADLRFSVADENWRMQLAYARHDDLETGMTGAGAIDPVTSGQDSRLNVKVAYDNEQISEHWGAKGELQYRHIDYSSGEGFQEWPAGYEDSGGGVYPKGVINRMRSAEHAVNAEVSGLYKGFESHALTVGTGVRWQDIYRVEQWVNSGVDATGAPLPPGGPVIELTDTPYAFAPEKARTITYLFVQDVWSINDDWELTAGARYDHNSDFGDALTPRVALVWQASDEITAKLLYGQAYRAPYFQELYTTTSFSLPNDQLEAERSETWELSLSYMPTRDFRIGGNVFRFEQSDFITTRAVAGLPLPQFHNAGKHVINGIELESWWQVSPDVRLSGNYAFNDPDDSQFRAIGSPQHQAYLRADWEFRPGWNLNVQTNWIGKRDRSSTDPRPAVDDYAIVDSTLRYAGVKNWDFAFSVRNLFDADAREYTRSSIPDDLPLPERSFYVEARYDLDSLWK